MGRAAGGWPAGARRIFLMPLSIFSFPCTRMRVAASGAATWDLTRYIGPVRPQTSVGERPTLPTFSLSGFSLSSSSQSISVQSPAVGAWSLVRGMVLVSPKEARLSWLSELAMPAMLELYRPTRCLPPSGLLPSACPAYHPTPNAAWTVPPPVPGRQGSLFGARVCRAPLTSHF